MKLLTKDIEKKLIKRSTQPHNRTNDDRAIVKFFNPTGIGTWIIFEGEKQENGDWLLFGMCDLGHPEWGYVSLNDLQSIKLKFGLGIERDMYSKMQTRQELDHHYSTVFGYTTLTLEG